MSGGDGMDSLLECVMPRARGFLLLCSIVATASDRHYSRPTMANTYLHRGAPMHVEARVPFPGSWVR
jgi:hypothetical protein